MSDIESAKSGEETRRKRKSKPDDVVLESKNTEEKPKEPQTKIKKRKESKEESDSSKGSDSEDDKKSEKKKLPFSSKNKKYKNITFNDNDVNSSWSEDIIKKYNNQINLFYSYGNNCDKYKKYYNWLRICFHIFIIILLIISGALTISSSPAASGLIFVILVFYFISILFGISEKRIKYEFLSRQYRIIAFKLNEEKEKPLQNRHQYPVKFYNEIIDMFRKIIEQGSLYDKK